MPPEPYSPPESTDTTVKCCLKKAFLAGGAVGRKDTAPLFELLNDTVVFVSRAARRGSLVALLTTLRTLRERDGRLPDDFFGSSVDTFFAQCFKFGHLKASKNKNGEVVWKEDLPESKTTNAYVKATLADAVVRGALVNQRLRRREGDSNLITAAALEYETAFVNFFDCDLPRRMKTCVIGLWQHHYPEIDERPKGQRSKCISYVADIWKTTSPAPEPEVSPALLEALKEVREKHVLMLGDECPERLAIAVIRKEAEEAKANEAKAKASQDKTDESDKKDKKKNTMSDALAAELRVLRSKRIFEETKLLLRRIEFAYWMSLKLRGCGECKRFAMAPVSSAQRKHVRIDGNVFRDYLFPRLKDTGYFKAGMTKEDLGTKGLLRAQMDALFPGAQRLRTPGAGWRRGDSYTTDGYALGVHFVRGNAAAAEASGRKRGGATKAKPKSRMTREEKNAEKSAGCVFEVREGARIVGMDMGVVNIFCAAWRDKKGAVVSSTLTRKKYYEASGVKAYKAFAAHKAKPLQKFVEGLSETTFRSERLEDVLRYVKRCDEANEAVWGVYGDRRFSRGRMAVFIGKQRALDQYFSDLAGRFKGDAVPPQVSCGYPSFNCCFKGCPAAPTNSAFKTLKRRMEVIPADEYRTSKVCSRCDETMEPPRKMMKMRDGKERCGEVRGIRLCKKCALETHGRHAYKRDPGLWPGYARFDRDVNAALNMIRVAGTSNETRPASLQRINRQTEEGPLHTAVVVDDIGNG
jgi:hypothetical protein